VGNEVFDTIHALVFSVGWWRRDCQSSRRSALVRPTDANRCQVRLVAPLPGEGTSKVQGNENFPSCLHGRRNSGSAAAAFCGTLEIGVVL